MASRLPHAWRRRPGDRAGRRRRRTARAAHARARQAGRVFRRPVPHHRLRPEQLHQLRTPPHLHRDAVQVALAQPPHPPGMDGRVGGARRVHRDPAAAKARRRALVSRHGRRGLSEPLLRHPRKPALRRRARGRSRLQDGLPEDAALPPGHGGGGHAGGDRSADRGRQAIRHRRGRRDRSGHGVSREAGRIRRRCPGNRASRSRRWASTSSTATC